MQIRNQRIQAQHKNRKINETKAKNGQHSRWAVEPEPERKIYKMCSYTNFHFDIID